MTTTTTPPCTLLGTAFKPESPAIPIPNGSAAPLGAERLATASVVSGSGQVRVGVISGDDDVTFGASVSLGSADAVRLSAVGGLVFAVYSRPQGLFARALRVAGVAIDLGAELQVSVSPPGAAPVPFDLVSMSANGFVVLRGGSFARAVAVAPNLALTAGTDTPLGVSEMAAGTQTGPAELVVATSNLSGAARVRTITVSGGTLALGPALDVPPSPAAPEFAAVFMPTEVVATGATNPTTFVLTVAKLGGSDAFVGSLSPVDGAVALGPPTAIPFTVTGSVSQRAGRAGDDASSVVLIGPGGFASACVSAAGDTLTVLATGPGIGTRIAPFPREVMSDDLNVVVENELGVARVGELKRREFDESTPPPVVTTLPPITIPPGAATFSVRDISPWPFYSPGIDLAVTVQCSLDSVAVSTYIVEEIYPIGWTVALGSVSDGGVDNGTSVRWFFLDNLPRTLSYILVPKVNGVGSVPISGTLSVDGSAGLSVVLTAGPQSLRGAIHPAEARPGKRPNFKLEIDDVLSYVRAFKEDDDLRFPGISNPNRIPFVLRAAVIWKTNFQGRYRDDSSAEPLDSDKHSDRWQEDPD